MLRKLPVGNYFIFYSCLFCIWFNLWLCCLGVGMMAYKNTHQRAVRFLKGIPKSSIIIDLGCGYGEVAEMLKLEGFKDIQCFDINPSNYRLAKYMDLNKGISLESDSADVIIATEVIEHLENKYLFLRECRRVLGSGGILILSFPNVYNIFNRMSFLFKGKFIEFNENEKEHMNVMFLWELNGWPKEITFNRGFIPVLRMPFFNNILFGQSMIVKLIAPP